MKEYKIINVHVHLDDYSGEGLGIKQMVSRLREDMRENKIDHVGIMAGCWNQHLEPGREELFNEIGREKDLSIISGYSAILDGPTEIAFIENAVKKNIVKGIKLFCGYEYFYPFDSRLKNIYLLCQKYKLPVFIHCGVTMYPTAQLEYSRPIHVDRAAVENPDINFVICHLGYPWLRDAAEVIRKNKNVYGDISGMTDVPLSSNFGKLLVRDMNELHAYMDDNFSKLLFGTDWPLFKTEWYLDLIEKIDLNDKEKELILWKNAANLLKI